VYQLDGLREAGSIAVSGDGRWLALGDRKGVPTSDLRIYEVHTSGTESNGEDVSLTLRYTCSLFTGGIKAKSELNRLMKGLGFAGTRIENEGLHAATFSPDAGRVAVITRNGRVVSWKLDGESPASLFDTPTGEDSVNNAGRILYSPDGRTIYANWADARTGRIVRIIDAETGEIRQEMRESTWDIGLLNDGRLLLSQDPAVERIGADESTDRVSLPKRDGTTLANIDVCADRPLMFLNSGTLATVDPITGLYGVDFESRGTSPRRVCFTSDSGIVCGECGPEFLRLWDALSGKWIQDVSFPGEEVPKIAVHSERNRIFVASHQSLKVFAVRGTEHLSIAGQADSKAASSGTVNDQKLSANTPMVSRQALISAPGILPAQTESHTAAINSPRQGDVLPRLPEFNDAVVNVFAPGSDIVTAIDLSGDGNTLAVLEQPAGNSGDRTRVRKMDTIRGAEIERWTCAATEASTVAVTGSDIAFTGNGNRITVAAGIPGNLILLTENGFDIPSGAGLDVPRNPPVSAEGKSATWSPFPEIALERKFQVAVAVYFPRALFQSKEYLEFELSSSNKISKYRADDRIVDSKGWYLLMLGNVASETLSNDWSLKLTLTADGLSMATASTEVGASGSVVAGDAYAFPTRGVDGKRKTVGPVSGRGDNGIVGAVENFLFQWNPGESLPTGSPWMDLVNNQEDIRSISSARSCTLVGSNSGLVGILNADNSFKNLQDGFKASVDSRDGCTATAITPDARFGFVGTRGGQLRVYNLTSEQNRPAFEVAAHSRGITALAVTDDGEIVSSADDNGKLRFWRRVDDTLELLFEMTRDSSPIVDLRFGPEGHFLYLLRKNERGIRRIDLKRLIDLYGIYGLSE
jgi:WD40 repeat protein